MSLKYKKQIEQVLNDHATQDLVSSIIRRRSSTPRYFLSLVSPEGQVYNGRHLEIGQPKTKIDLWEIREGRVTKEETAERADKMADEATQGLIGVFYEALFSVKKSHDKPISLGKSTAVISEWRYNPLDIETKRKLAQKGRAYLNVSASSNLLPGSFDFYILNALMALNKNSCFVYGEMREKGHELPFVAIEHDEFLTPTEVLANSVDLFVSRLIPGWKISPESPYRTARGIVNLEQRTAVFHSD